MNTVGQGTLIVKSRLTLICQNTKGMRSAGFEQVSGPVLLPQATSNADSSASSVGDECCTTVYSIGPVRSGPEMGPGTDALKIRVCGRRP